MKRSSFLKTISFIILICSAIGIYSGCDANKSTIYKLNFIVDADVYHTVKVISAVQGEIVMPKEPTKNGYDFAGWYFDDGSWEKPFEKDTLVEKPITGDTSVYAKWAIHEHNYKQVTVAATCTDDGYTMYKCSCGETYTDNYVDAYGHTFTEVVTEPTCDQKGYTTYVCDCGYTYTDNITDMTGHIYTETVVQPTCTEKGYSAKVCSKCNDAQISSYIDPLGHLMGDYVLSDNGIRVAVCKRADCGFEDYATDGITYTLEDKSYIVSGYYGEKKEIIIPMYYNGKEVVEIGQQAFKSSRLFSIVIGDNVRKIGDNAFDDCDKLVSVTLGKSIDEIGSNAFDNCIRLVEICNRSSVSIIKGDGDFGKIGLFAKHIYTPDNGSTRLSVEENCIFYSDNKHYLVSFIADEVPEYMPSGCNGDMYSINDYAFYGCDGLKFLNLPKSVDTIGKYAFAFCKDLIKVDMGRLVSKVELNAFFGCNKLIEIYNRSNLNIEIGSEANGHLGFYAKNVYTDNDGNSKIKNENDYYFFEDNGSYLLIGYYGAETELSLPEKFDGNNYAIYDYAFYENKNIKKVEVPFVTSVGVSAFRDCSSLSEVIFDDGVKVLSSHIFDGCEKLKRVVLPVGLTTVGEFAFFNCGSITDIIIPDSVTVIEGYAFAGCVSLKNVTVGTGVTEIGVNAFSYCVSLESIVYKGTVEQWDVIVKGLNWNYYIPATKVECSNGEAVL